MSSCEDGSITRLNEVASVIPVLERYAKRGIFQGFSVAQPTSRQVRAKIMWHYDRPYEILADADKSTIRVKSLLPEVPARSVMYKSFKAFIESFGSVDQYPHRQVDPAKAKISPVNNRGSASFAIKVLDGDYAYAAQKLTHVAHEVFLAFLPDGPYWEYRIDVLGLNPDAM